jgi:hypothetical protein
MADALHEAQELYNESLEAMRDQRRQIEEDLEFSDPSNPQQWEEDVKRARETDPGGKRPCYVYDQTGQFVANVAGQVEQNPPSLHAIPVSGGADKKAAEQIDGRFRHIEHASAAMQHYARALTAAARVGVGYLTIRPEYVDRALNWQEPRIGSEADSLRVVFDPWSVATNGSDAEFAYLINSMPLSMFKRKWGEKRELCDFGDLDRQNKDDDRKSILIAECWKKEATTKNVIVYVDATGEQVSGGEEEYHAASQAAGQQLQFIRNYTDKTTKVVWYQMSGADVLEESEYPADHIGIVPVYGYIGFSGGRMKYCGIPRRARAPQQAYNLHMSENSIPNTIVLMPERALGGGNLKDLWDKARVQRRAYVPYIDQDVDGPVAPPTVVNIDGVNHQLGAENALRDIQASIGMYQASLGAPSNETSGVAIESRKQQGEASTAHFPSHMAASLGHLGNIVMQMDARLTDTKRMQPIIGVDESAGSVTVNPDQQEAFIRTEQGASINPKVGKYGVRVVVGASYSTQRTQTNAAFAEIMRGNKELAQVVAPFWAQTLDFPGSDKFAQAMAAMAPAPVKAILQPEGNEAEQDPAMLVQQITEMKAALQEAIQHAQEAQDDADQSVDELASIKRDKEIDQYKADTDRMKVTGANEEQITAITQKLINDMLSQEGPLPGDTSETGMDPAMRQPDAWQGGQPMPEQQMQPMPEQEMQPEAPEPPSPEIMSLLDGQQQTAQAIQQIVQGQQSIGQMLQELAALTKRTRRRIPVRNTDGDITEVIDKMDDETQESEG